MKEIIEVLAPLDVETITVIPRERAQQRTDDPIADVPVPSFHEQHPTSAVQARFRRACRS